MNNVNIMDILKEKLREKSIAIALKNNKNQGINLTKEVKVLHFAKYKTLVKESNDTQSLWIRKIKAIYRFNAICVNIPKVFFTKLEQTFLKFTWKQKESQRYWERRTKLEVSHSSISKELHYQATVIKQYGNGTKTDTKINETE